MARKTVPKPHGTELKDQNLVSYKLLNRQHFVCLYISW